jgi:uncharacterized protein YkwD
MRSIRCLIDQVSRTQRRGTTRRKPSLESLEQRTVPDAVPLNNYEQYFLELTNRARQDPAGEAARLGIDLNEGLDAGTISTEAKQPLAPNQALYNAIRGHLQDLLTRNVLDHTGGDGRNPGQRISDAGYMFTTWGENLGFQGTGGTPDETALVRANYEGLFIDDGVDSRGHRRNILNGNYKELGPGEVTGTFMDFNAVLVGQDFATREGNSFLTGVIYSDTVTKDNFYTPGEGIGQVTITAVSDQGTFTEVTGPAGGYALQLPPGTYTVTASGGTLQNPIAMPGIVIGMANVKQDFLVDQPPPAPGGGGSSRFSPGAEGVLSLSTSLRQPLAIPLASAVPASVKEQSQPLQRERVNAVFAAGTESSLGITSAWSKARVVSVGNDGWTSLFGANAEVC